MASLQIAENRFGLGARPDRSDGGDARQWLIRQLDGFDPRPAVLASVPGSEAVARAVIDYRQQLMEEGVQPGRARNQNGDQGTSPPAGQGSPQDQRRARRRMMQQGANAPMAGPMSEMDGRDPAMPGMAGQAMAGQGMDTMAAMPPGQQNPMGGLEQRVQQFVRERGRELYPVAVAARVQAAVATDTPFAERLVHFWSNHFAVSTDKPAVLALAGPMEFEAIRPHVMGTFRDMVRASTRHPAMLMFLDQAQSVGPDSVLGQRARRRQLGLNENLAREILELHTLGVKGGYSQNDVTEFARALTGWTAAGFGRGQIARRLAGQADASDGAFQFVPQMHQPGARTILGRTYPDGGEEQALAVLDMLAVHPMTARHIATKLTRHFAGDTPPPAMVARLEKAFLASDGDLPTLYRAIIDSPEAWVPEPVKFRTPWEWNIAALRALNVEEAPRFATVGLLGQLGQPVWRPGSPAGFDDIAASWAAPDAVMRRVEAAERLAMRMGRAADARALAPKLFPDTLGAATSQAIARAEDGTQALALLLACPEMMRR
ncbi:DUF1800 domain-containing protein [Sphingomonas sp. BGYR3]|uniref:DUF1800 domain-containing protein n=1 Tax=Sphingomonas sp. BGYR3 TaxID=2975483 RepID=UPI0021A2DB95|nr:DUF1800 domain-containing protein [Sphingomonas sp. BGYR3]MDG5488142.1 DUF1800 domain-containing protein [Sphingomonas sp. BGYR3]